MITGRVGKFGPLSGGPFMIILKEHGIEPAPQRSPQTTGTGLSKPFGTYWLSESCSECWQSNSTPHDLRVEAPTVACAYR